MIRIIRAYRRGVELGRARQRAEDLRFIREQADLHRGGPSDRKRRGALNHVADRIEQGRGVGRP